MTSNFIILAAPIFAFVAVIATTAFTVFRIHRYGRVFNWPPRPADIDQATTARKK